MPRPKKHNLEIVEYHCKAVNHVTSTSGGYTVFAEQAEAKEFRTYSLAFQYAKLILAKQPKDGRTALRVA